MFTKTSLSIALLSTLPLSSAVISAELDTLLVTATLASQKSEEAPAFATVITADDIQKSAVSSVSDLLRETVGVNNSTDTAGRDEVQIRGLDGAYTVILVNGKRVSSSSAFAKGSDADLSSVPLNSIERVEIIRGPMSALYGADAIGGVVNIITKQPLDNHWERSVSAGLRMIESGDEGAQYRLGASAQGPLNEKLKVSVSAEALQQDPWFAESGDDVSLREERQTNNLNSTLSWQATEQQQVDFDFGYNNDERPYQEYAEGRYRKQEITRIDLGVTHKGSWDWGNTTAFIKQENSDVYDYNSSYPTAEHDGLEQNNTYAKAYADTVLGVHSLLAGVDYKLEEVTDPYFLTNGTESTGQYGVFLQDGIALTDALNLTLSGRMDDHEIYGSNFSPKAYLVFDAGDGLTFKGGVSKAFKAPSIAQSNSSYSQISCGGSCYLNGNSDLEAETSTSYEFGFELRKSSYDVSGAIFRNNIDNMISRTVDRSTTPITVQWVNVNKAMTQGLELSSTIDLSENLMATVNYTYLDTESEDESGNVTELTGRAKHQAMIGLDHQTTDRVATFLNLNYISGMKGTDDNYDIKTLPSYYRADIGLIADVTNDLVIRAGIKNLNDVRLDKEDSDFATFELGRSYYVSANLSF
ncbi:TonB-dependent receptor domain-containing protein [Marinomonas communis]|uniref:Outer membrane receptor for ferrienterochelin and colicins n=1 Tax=Marinomonas communis TaxID=28254 RepID=A0A4R6X7M1_9GAMM|nr:TonB-dependent receptor [Marinomonas communis]TDR12977.1 outer membrane receptor for ferrienterochelin and colicins [Marinomonas communis]